MAEAPAPPAAGRAPPDPPRDPHALMREAATHRRELLLHCYRFTGSLHDAEDLVQETYARAWRAAGRFKGEAALKTWLYRIATHASLDALARRKRRRQVFPEDVGGSTTRMPAGPPALDVPWIEPLPSAGEEGVRDPDPGPALRYQARETVRLAFIAATQRLPPRQRAVLLLRDVLGWSAVDTARALKTTVASVKSALQRARATVGPGLGAEEAARDRAEQERQLAVAQAYADAWERSDLDRLVRLLAQDAILSMPPYTEWYRRRRAIRTFLAHAFDWAWRGRRPGAFRLVPLSANNQPGFATYLRRPGQAAFHAHAIQVLAFRSRRIARLTLFVGAGYFAAFGLARRLKPARRGPGAAGVARIVRHRPE